MTKPPKHPLYVLDEVSADRVVGLGLKFIAALRELLDDRRIELPDSYDVGIDELLFLEDQSRLVIDANLDVELDETF